MNAKRFRIALLLMIFLAATGCSDDPAAPPGDTGDGSAVIAAGGGSFEMPVACVGPDGYFEDGAFLLRGGNLRYDDQRQALAVDLTVTNLGAYAPPEPVRLVLQAVMPDSAVVIGADNGLTGPGAAFVFEFANDDGIWTSGEISFPRTVMFGIDPGVAVAFVGEIHAGPGDVGGAIRGLVWNDFDEDGVRDPDEPGLPGVPILLVSDDIQGSPLPMIRHTETGPEGRYEFGSLAAGYFDVSAAPYLGRELTTPELIHVLLTDSGGGVADFEGADFGYSGLPYPLISVRASADATVRTDLDDRRNDNYGLAPHLDVGGGRGGGGMPYGSADGIRSLIRFDLPEFAAPIEHAWLELTILEFVEGWDQSYRLDVHRIVDSGDRTPWIEGNGSEWDPSVPGAVWVDEAYGVAWVGAGDGGDATNVTRPDFDPRLSGSVEFRQADLAPWDFVRIEVTELVQGWISGAYPNHGLVLRDITSDGTHFKQIRFASKDVLSLLPVEMGPRLVLEIGD